MLQLRLMERKSELVRRDEHEAMIDQMAGLVWTKLGGWPARLVADLVVRRRAESRVARAYAPRSPSPAGRWPIRTASRSTPDLDRTFAGFLALEVPKPLCFDAQ